MITRTVSGVTYTLTYNAENRLTQVVSGTLTASYTYDGDGHRVRSVITAGSQVTETHYVGAHYERTLNSGNTKYYTIAGQLVAFERSSGYGVDWGRRFVFRDHLGSTNVIINGSSGLLLWRDRYLPFGDVRDTYRKDAGFSLQTQYRFTGQRLEQRLGAPEGGLDRGLYFYGARWYDSSLGRFIQADTIVPQPGNPQSLNRYSYVLNNPLRYMDPSGHWPIPPRFPIEQVILRILNDPNVKPLWQNPQIGAPVLYSAYREAKGDAPEALSLTLDWYFERGKAPRDIGSDSEITQFLITSRGVQEAREQFAKGGGQDMTLAAKNAAHHRTFPLT